jgi:hypothetical protein
MEKKIHVIGFGLLLAFRLQAMEQPQVPTQCPNIEAIKSLQITALDMIQTTAPQKWTDPNGHRRLDPGIWETRVFVGDFKTNQQWTFNIRSIQVWSAEEAAQEARNTLLALSLKRGPYKLGYSWLYDWNCSYEAPGSKSALATMIKKG